MDSENHRYKWDGETKDDSPSEFSTTTFPASTGVLYGGGSRGRRRRPRATRRAGLTWVMAAAVGTSALVLYVLARLLHH